MLSALAVTLFASLAPLQEPGTGVVRGQIRSERTGEPLPYAMIEVVGTATPVVAVADSAGGYRLREVPAGRRLLRARSFGHTPFEVEVLVRPGAELVVDIALGFEPVVLAPVTAQVSALPQLSDTVAAPAAELSQATLHALDATPGVIELGLGELAHGVPGQEPVDPSDVLYVRGSSADLKLVLLDGAPIYAPSHVGGLIRAFDPGVLRAADLHLGGAPARYDGGLSYVLDLETRAGRRTGLRTEGAVDLLSANLLAEGPVGSVGGVIVAARSVHGLGSKWILGERFPYGYNDALARFDFGLGAIGQVAVTGYWNQESVRLGEVGPVDGEVAAWGNGAASLRYRARIGESDASIVAALGSYRARLPLGEGDPHVMADGSARRARLSADFARSVGATRIYYGLSFERLSLDYRAWTQSMLAPDALRLETAADGSVGGAYADIDWRVVPRLRVRGGLRADRFSQDETTRLAPRFSATWLVSDRAALTLAAGRYRQLVRSGGPKLVSMPGSGPALEVPPPLALARASHLVMGLDQELVDGLRLGIEGYYKKFEGLPVADEAEPSHASDTGRGEAMASGVDLWLRRGTGHVTGWFGYSLGWVWSPPRRGAATEYFSGRQLLSAGLSGPIAARGRFDLRVGYGAGIPFTAVPAVAPDADYDAAPMAPRALASVAEAAVESPPLSGPPDDPYLRLDVEISHPWATRWYGTEITITPYFKVLNALDRRDSLFYRADDGDGEPRPLAALPLLPVIGVQWTF